MEARCQDCAAAFKEKGVGGIGKRKLEVGKLMTKKINEVTIGALREFLKDIPDHYTIILSKDGEGNSFSPLSSDISFGNFIPETPFIGDFEFDDDKPTSIVLFPLS